MSVERDPSEPTEGQVWQHKRQTYRRVTIKRVHEGYVYVSRNTSRRTQAIKVTTLRHHYELESG